MSALTFYSPRLPSQVAVAGPLPCYVVPRFVNCINSCKPTRFLNPRQEDRDVSSAQQCSDDAKWREERERTVSLALAWRNRERRAWGGCQNQREEPPFGVETL